MSYITPVWPAPKNVKAYCTTKQSGFSYGSYATFNLADHVADDLLNVLANRNKLRQDLALPEEPIWLKQTHSNKALCLDAIPDAGLLADVGLCKKLNCEADAAYTSNLGKICVILTADCLPILVCDKAGTKVAAIHAGWKGLSGGIIENTIAALNVESADLLVWFGPAISSKHFIVGADVYSIFCEHDNSASEAFRLIHSTNEAKFYADIYLLAKQRLQKLRINNIYGGEFCTYTDSINFFSYRRDGKLTGRMASLIYLDKM